MEKGGQIPPPSSPLPQKRQGWGDLIYTGDKPLQAAYFLPIKGSFMGVSIITLSVYEASY